MDPQAIDAQRAIALGARAPGAKRFRLGQMLWAWLRAGRTWRCDRVPNELPRFQQQRQRVSSPERRINDLVVSAACLIIQRLRCHCLYPCRSIVSDFGSSEEDVFADFDKPPPLSLPVSPASIRPLQSSSLELDILTLPSASMMYAARSPSVLSTPRSRHAGEDLLHRSYTPDGPESPTCIGVPASAWTAAEPGLLHEASLTDLQPGVAGVWHAAQTISRAEHPLQSQPRSSSVSSAPRSAILVDARWVGDAHEAGAPLASTPGGASHSDEFEVTFQAARRHAQAEPIDGITLPFERTQSGPL